MVSNASSSRTRPGVFTTIAEEEKVTFEREIKKSKFIAIAGFISDERSAHFFVSQLANMPHNTLSARSTIGAFGNTVRDPRATHSCWAYKVGEQYRSNDDGEPSGTAGKPIQSAIMSSGIDR